MIQTPADSAGVFLSLAKKLGKNLEKTWKKVGAKLEQSWKWK